MGGRGPRATDGEGGGWGIGRFVATTRAAEYWGRRREAGGHERWTGRRGWGIGRFVATTQAAEYWGRGWGAGGHRRRMGTGGGGGGWGIGRFVATTQAADAVMKLS